MTKEHANQLVYHFEITRMLEDELERELLFQQNPELVKALVALIEYDPLICPFCQKDDFDLPGLKFHLLNWCEEFNKTEDIYWNFRSGQTTINNITNKELLKYVGRKRNYGDRYFQYLSFISFIEKGEKPLVIGKDFVVMSKEMFEQLNKENK